MVGPSPTPDTQDTGTTVFAFPGKRVLTRSEAAGYLGIRPLRLRLLEIARCGPIPFAPGRYRTTELDVYRTELFLRAGLPSTEAERRNRRAESLPQNDETPRDPFVEMATLHDLRQVGTFIIGRVAIGIGFIIIVMSHTPLWHFLRHSLK
ncbi:hypothetical protein [Acetobacter fallax]|uniref:Helix-turn-helix domain-containing protein n=1 Tax=Acetobacter fallax TaxID=1737473 RepID=A0ABX0KB16_9PROT|nr:hypothetical protein [Acetobacter fallax]NHO32216.1 hypothetical protein [Acetobacter fallax]NHO35731.1 hypothetical protein [Acetobacter fallax]